MNKDLVRLRKFITEHFNLAELRSVCIDLEIDYDELREGGKTDKVVDLLRIVGKENNFEQLLTVLKDHKKIPFARANLEPTAELLEALQKTEAESKPARLLAIVFGGLGVVGLAAIIIFLMTKEDPSEPILIGIGSLQGCSPQWAETVRDNVPESGKVEINTVEEITSHEAALTFADTYDLAIWGQCEQTDLLSAQLEILMKPGPDTVIEVEAVSLNVMPTEFSSLTEATMNYLQGNFREAAVTLATLRSEGNFTMAEEAQLILLQGNSWLFAGEYETAVAIYNEILTYAPLTTSIYNNRGVAHMNWALQLQEAGQPFDSILQNALDDFTQAERDAHLQTQAFLNRSQAQYLINDDFTAAQNDCIAALETTSTALEAQAYVCRAASLLMPLLYDAACDLPTISQIQEDLDTAELRQPKLAAIKFWRGQLFLLQAHECDQPGGDDQERHENEGTAYLEAFLKQVNSQTVILATDQYLTKIVSGE